MDDGRHTPCCQFASAEDLSQDPEIYQCESCEVMAHLDGLHPANRRAWTVFHQVCTRFLMESHAVSVVLAQCMADEADADDAVDLITRLSLLYDIFYPPKTVTPRGS